MIDLFHYDGELTECGKLLKKDAENLLTPLIKKATDEGLNIREVEEILNQLICVLVVKHQPQLRTDINKEECDELKYEF